MASGPNTPTVSTFLSYFLSLRIYFCCPDPSLEGVAVDGLWGTESSLLQDCKVHAESGKVLTLASENSRGRQSVVG